MGSVSHQTLPWCEINVDGFIGIGVRDMSVLASRLGKTRDGLLEDRGVGGKGSTAMLESF